jgi:hypothetical protein
MQCILAETEATGDGDEDAAVLRGGKGRLVRLLDVLNLLPAVPSHHAQAALLLTTFRLLRAARPGREGRACSRPAVVDAIERALGALPLDRIWAACKTASFRSECDVLIQALAEDMHGHDTAADAARAHVGGAALTLRTTASMVRWYTEPLAAPAPAPGGGGRACLAARARAASP